MFVAGEALADRLVEALLEGGGALAEGVDVLADLPRRKFMVPPAAR